MSEQINRGVVTRTEYFPLVIIEFYTSEDEALLGAFQDSERLMQGGRPWIVLRDMRYLREMPHAKQRRMAAEWSQKNHDELNRLCVAAVNVIPSPILRGVLKAVYWLTPAPMPEHVVGTLDEALAIVEKLAAERGLPITRGLSALRKGH